MPKCGVSLGSRIVVQWRLRFVSRSRNPLAVYGRIMGRLRTTGVIKAARRNDSLSYDR
jgi:hypothetical protein